MKNVNQLFRLFNEVVFVLVGWLLLWLAMTGRYLFDPRQPSWLILSGVLVVWGVVTWGRSGRTPVRTWRIAARIGGASLVLAGLLMMSLAWAPFRLVGWLLAAAGAVFILRGVITAALVLRPT